MAVLLHVQGSGRDHLRPFGGHAIRTITWERFDPTEVERDVDAIVMSPAEPGAVGDVVTTLRSTGGRQRVLVVPGDGPGWREFSGARLPGADVVLGGIAGLPDYLGPPDDTGGGTPRRSVERTADVIDLRVPRGPGRRMLYERMGGQGPAVANAMRSWAFEVTGADPADHPRPGAPAVPTASASVATPAERAVDPASVERSDERSDVIPAREAPADVAGTDTDEADPPVPLTNAPDTPALPPDAPPAPEPVPRRAVVAQSPSTVAAEPGAELSGRRLARSLEDPAVLVPAALAQIDRLVEAARTPRALADYLLEHIGADAVEVLVPVGGAWHTEVTVGECRGAGTVAQVVDVPGLVAWLESSFDSPVVLDGSDLGAAGSWVLAAPTRHGDRTVGLLLAWRQPGRSIFDPAAVTAVDEVRADAAASLELATAVRRLARALAPVAD
jgi:hypothetical protein